MARWTIQENESAKTGIPQDLNVAVLLRRKDLEPFVMKLQRTEVKVSGFSFEPAFAVSTTDDPVRFDSKMALKIWHLPFEITEGDQRSLDKFWHSQMISRMGVVGPSMPVIIPPTALETNSESQIPAISGAAVTPERISGVDSQLAQKNWNEATTVYAELWNNENGKFGCVEVLSESDNLRWRDWEGDVDEASLFKCFSWIKDEARLELPDTSNVDGPQQYFRATLTEDTTPKVQPCAVEAFGAPYTLCSLLLVRRSFPAVNYGDDCSRRSVLDFVRHRARSRSSLFKILTAAVRSRNNRLNRRILYH